MTGRQDTGTHVYENPERTLLGQPEPLVVAYDTDERHEATVRDITLREQNKAVSEWLFALELFAYALTPEREFNTGTVEEDRVADGAYALRLQLLALSGRAAKPVLDLIVSGYYTESWSLLRLMLEGWAAASTCGCDRKRLCAWMRATRLHPALMATSERRIGRR
jgi:hypothetical protein